MKTLLTLVLLSLSLFLHSQEIITGIATNIYDGDTFTLVKGEDKIKIRVVGIDAPEKKQDGGIESRDFARELIDNKQVTIYLEPGETYGRKLGIVISSEGKHFNYEMVKNGHAWHYKHYNSDKYLAAAQKEAQKNKTGLWSKSDPLAPWEFRKQQKSGKYIPDF